MMHPTVIFVRPQAHGNVGALSRVMSNFSCSDLRLVSEVAGNDSFGKDSTPFDWGMACKGKTVLESLQVYQSLSEAIHDQDFVLGTTARPRVGASGYSREYLEAGEAFQEVFEKCQDTAFKWALVIGAENDGLSDYESSFCHKLCYIECSEKSSSMNAAMAAGALLFYWNQLWVAQKPKQESFSKVSQEKASLSSLQDRESFLNYLCQLLEHTSFFKYPDIEATKARFRRWLQNSEIPRGELLFAFEALYHLKAKITGKFEERNFLTKE